MIEFLTALLTHSFLQNALLAGLLASLACGVVGALVVARRISYLAGGIAHSVLAGMGAARYLQVVHGLEWATPMLGALAAALAAGLVMGLVSLMAKEREDTVIGAIWAVGMAVGILFMAATPGYQTDLMAYLLGDILLVTRGDLWVMTALDLAAVGLVAALYQRLAAVCFDPEFARVRGIHAGAHYLLVILLTALTVVILAQVVGIIMVIALMTLPAAAAGRLLGRLGAIMLAAALLSGVVTTGGLAAAFVLDLPAGAVIIVLAGGAYLLAAGAGRLAGR